MANAWVNILMAICTIGIAALPPTGDLFTGAPKKRPTWRYWVIVLLTLTSFLIGIIKDNNAANEKEADQKSAQAELDRRDSIAKNRTDESNDKIVEAFANGLGKYQLKYDSSTNEIIRIIRDSAKRVVNAPEEEPSLLLDTRPVTLDSSTGNIRHFSIYIKSFRGQPDNINLQVSVVKSYADKFEKLPDNMDVGIANESLSEGMKTILPIDLYTSKGAIIYFYVFGSYTNKKKSLKFQFDDVCFFDLDKNESGFLTSFMNKKIREIARKKTR